MATIRFDNLGKLTPSASVKIPALDGTTKGHVLASELSGESGASEAPEGTSVKSTGEGGGSKYLREDGLGGASWVMVLHSADGGIF